MRRILAVFFLLPCMGSAAVIDFEDLPDRSTDPLLESGGFLFEYLDPYFTGTGPEIRPFPSLPTVSYSVCYLCGAPVGFEFSPTNGKTFDLLSLDFGEASVSGQRDFAIDFAGLVDGSTQASLRLEFSALNPAFPTTLVFDSQWQNLTSVQIFVSSDISDGLGGISFDNISVSVIPVPAAVWLFVSAVASLAARKLVFVRPRSVPSD